MSMAHSSTIPLRLNDIEGWPGYRVDNHGLVWTCHRSGPPYGLTGIWRPLKSSLDRQGYPFVWLQFRRHKKIVRVHRLVLEAFVGPCPAGMECRHKDNDRGNPRLDNLAWGTKAENMADKIGHGTNNHGERNGSARLTELDILDIRRLKLAGITDKENASIHGVSRSNIYLICKGSTWKHL